MTVSIIIAVKIWQKNLEECVGKCLELDYPDFEILILPDAPLQEPLQGLSPKGLSPSALIRSNSKGTVPISIIPTGPVTPAQKRDIALNYAKGDILAYLDDDAYPLKDWLKRAVENFKDEEVAAVGGPAITPQSDGLMQKASGMVYASFAVSGQYAYRYIPKRRREVDDYPTCNLLVRKSVMRELGGFKTNFWPGEDSKLCLDITKRLKKKIIYSPDVLIYHHRRPLFIPHLKQVASYGLHRGYFVKKYPETSLRFSYFIPAILLLVLAAGGALSLLFASLKGWYLAGVSLYLLLVFMFSISKELQLIPLIFSGIILTHLVYGFYFLKGLLSKKLAEEKGTVPVRANSKRFKGDCP